MTTKITEIFDNPTDPSAFEAGFAAHLDLARALPGVRRLESGKVWPKEDGSPTPAYRIVDLYFDDYASASQAVTTAEAGAWFGDVQRLATGGVRVVFFDVEPTS